MSLLSKLRQKKLIENSCHNYLCQSFKPNEYSFDKVFIKKCTRLKKHFTGLRVVPEAILLK